MPKFWDSTYLKTYGFPFKKVDLTIGKLLQLAVTPQIILVNKNMVTFSQDYKNISFQNEYKRLKKYLGNKYPE